MAGDMTIILDQLEEQSVKKELGKVFTFHGSRASDSHLADFMDEITNMGATYRQIISGLVDIQHQEDLQRVTIFKIKDAIRRHMSADGVGEVGTCPNCASSHGTVSMVRCNGSYAGYPAIFACTCERGQQQKRLARWNGEETMDYAGVRWVLWANNHNKPDWRAMA